MCGREQKLAPRGTDRHLRHFIRLNRLSLMSRDRAPGTEYKLKRHYALEKELNTHIVETSIRFL